MNLLDAPSQPPLERFAIYRHAKAREPICYFQARGKARALAAARRMFQIDRTGFAVRDVTWGTRSITMR